MFAHIGLDTAAIQDPVKINVMTIKMNNVEIFKSKPNINVSTSTAIAIAMPTP